MLKLRFFECLVDMSYLPSGSGIVHALTPPKVSNLASFESAGSLVSSVFWDSGALRAWLYERELPPYLYSGIFCPV